MTMFIGFEINFVFTIVFFIITIEIIGNFIFNFHQSSFSLCVNTIYPVREILSQGRK